MSLASHVERAVELLRSGELVAFPTETVYGLGADARNPLAVRRIFAAKERPADHPLIVHLASGGDAGEWAECDDRAWALATRFWPGPLTLVLPRKPGVPLEVTGGLDTIGIRVPAHPVARLLLGTFRGGVAAPSANRFGRISPTTAQHVRDELGDRVFVLDGGACPVGVESTIVDLCGDQPALLRPGGVPEEAIASVVGPLGRSERRAPGTLPSHYAPRTALRLAEDPDAVARELEERGLRVAVLRAVGADEYARQLYSELRRLDELDVDVLVAEPARGGGLGAAVNDRLFRAAAARSETDRQP